MAQLVHAKPLLTRHNSRPAGSESTRSSWRVTWVSSSLSSSPQGCFFFFKRVTEPDQDTCEPSRVSPGPRRPRPGSAAKLEGWPGPTLEDNGPKHPPAHRPTAAGFPPRRPRADEAGARDREPGFLWLAEASSGSPHRAGGSEMPNAIVLVHRYFTEIDSDSQTI